jgi:hypothetical protein
LGFVRHKQVKVPGGLTRFTAAAAAHGAPPGNCAGQAFLPDGRGHLGVVLNRRFEKERKLPHWRIPIIG